MIDPLILLRGIHFAATAFAAGTVAFTVTVLEPAARAIAAPADLASLRRRLMLLTWTALGVTILSGLGWLVLVAADILDTSIVDVWRDRGIWQVAASTRFGLVWSLRAVLALALGALLPWPPMRLTALGAAAGLIALPALTGHAGATPGLAGRIHLAADLVHLLAAGAWLGALPALALLLAQARRGDTAPWRELATRAIRRFSLIGIASVAALMASGLVNSWNLLGGPRDLLTTDYGRWLAVKIALFAAIVAIAAVNRYRLTPRKASPAALRALQRNNMAEISLGLCVLAAVGALGTLPPSGHTHVPTAEIPPDAAYVHIHSSPAMADVMIVPGRAAPVQVTIRVMREDFSEFATDAVTLALDPPSADIASVTRAAVRMPDGTWQIESIVIPQRGIWTARVIVAAAPGRPIILDAPIVINP